MVNRKTYTSYRSSKRSSKSRSKKFLNLFAKKVFLLIKEGYCPAQISRMLELSPSNLSYYIKHLKASGAITKIGYGVWKANEFDEKKFKKCEGCGSKPFIIAHDNFSSKDLKRFVRGHGFRFLVTIPRLEDWSLRRDYMRRKGIVFKMIPHGESVVVRGHRVKLFQRSFEVYFRKDSSFLGFSAEDSYKLALVEFNAVLIAFQRLFGVDLGRCVEWRVCRRHFSLMKNELAKDYLERGEKLQVRGRGGKLWLLIDNSFHLEEAETVDVVRSAKDMDDVVKPFFNDLRENRPPNLSEVMVLIKGIAQQNLETASGLNAVVELLKPKKDINEGDISGGKPDYFG